MKIFLLLTLILVLVNTNFATASVNDKSIIFYEDVPVGVIGGFPLFINIAVPKSQKKEPHPVVMLLHGGGFISGNKNNKNVQIKKLATQGYVSVSAMYRLSPQHKFPSQIEDIKLAIRFLKANASRYNLDPNKIIVSGYSAGSYLAVMIGVTGNSQNFSKHDQFVDYNSAVRAVTAQSAPIGDFTLAKNKNSLLVERLAGNPATVSNDVLIRLSPKTYLDSEDPPFFLSHGDHDTIVSVEMSRDFVRKLKQINHYYEYYEIKNGTHSFTESAPKESKRVFSKYLKFLKKWSK